MAERQQLSRVEYIERFYACLSAEKAGVIRSRSSSLARSGTTAFYHEVQQQISIDLSEIEGLTQRNIRDGAVLVVENISLEWIAALGVALDVDPQFFAEHAYNPPGQSPWKAVFGKWSANQRKPTQNGLRPQEPAWSHSSMEKTRRSWHVDGVFQYQQPQSAYQIHSPLNDFNIIPRQIAYEEEYGWQATTRISYSLVNAGLYLFLIDTPIRWNVTRDAATPQMRAQLHVPLALNRGGLVLPQLVGQLECSLSRCLHSFFSHPWHFHVLFVEAPGGTVPLAPETIFHLLATSTFGTNLRVLERKARRIGFDHIQRPGISMNNDLHDQRREISFMLSQVTELLKWIPPSVNAELKAIKDSLPAAKYIGYPDLVLQDVVESAESLEKFLMDTFSLLMSSISILEMESSRKQVLRGQRLTQLAFIYAPLSFVTGIFGMNVKEINGSPLPIWAAVVALVVTCTCTAAIFVFFNKRTRLS